MTQSEIKSTIADYEKKVKNPALPASAIARLSEMIEKMKAQLEEEKPAAPEDKKEDKAPAAKKESKKSGKFNKKESLDHWKGMSEKAAEEYAEYWGNLKKAWNKKETTLTKDQLTELKAYQQFIHSTYPQFDKYLTSQPVNAKKEKPAKKAAAKKDVDCDELASKEKEAEKLGYSFTEILEKEKARKKAAQERAAKAKTEPKKTPATKNKEVVESATSKVVINFQKRLDKGELQAKEVKKIISEYEAGLAKLKKILSKISGVKKMETGGRTSGSDENRDSMFKALPPGKRYSHKFAHVEARAGHKAYTRKNANQFVKAGHAGKPEKDGTRKTYYEGASNRIDKKGNSFK